MPRPPHLHPPLATYTSTVEVAEWVFESLDGLDKAISGLNDLIWLVSEHTIGRPDPPMWLSALVNQLTNELLDLLHDSIGGRGRPAVKSARSLFDLLVTAKDLSRDATLRERYERHRWPVLRDAVRYDERSATSAASRQAQHGRRVRSREVSQEAEAALAHYGSGFRLRWTTVSLFDRAARHGLSDDYEWYRIASALLHGSAGGVIGHYFEFKNGPRVYRAGPAIGLTADALALGLSWARQAFETLDSEIGAASLLLAQAVGAVEAFCPEFERLVNDYDRELWRQTQPLNLRLILVVAGPTAPNWYIRAGATSYIRPAIEPSLPSEQRDEVEDLVARISGPLVPEEVGTIEVKLEDRRVFPIPGSAWRDRPLFFQQPSLRWEAPRAPRGFDIREV